MAAESQVVENAIQLQCNNCGAPLAGRYCYECGQRDGHIDPSFHDLVHDLVHEFAHLDGKIVATLKALVFKPGKLSAEYFAGRRASYIGPVRLYLTFSLIFFLVLALEPAKSPLNQVHGKNVSQEEVRKAIDEEMHKADFTPNSFYGHLMRALLKASEEPEVARHNFLTNASRAEFFMVPVFAFGLMLAYKNRKKHYPTFIYFSLHFHAFAFCATTLRVLARLTNLSWLSRPAGIVVLVWIAVYLSIALRRTFGGSRISTLLRMAGLTVFYLPCYFIALVVVALITIYTI